MHVLRFNQQGNRLVVGTADNQVSIINLDAGLLVGPPLKCAEGRGTNELHFIEILPDSNVAVFGGLGGAVGRLNVTTGRRIGEFQNQPFPLTDMKLSPDGKTLMVLANDSIYLNDAATGRPLPRPSSRNVTCCAFVPDGKSIITGGKDRTARLWDLTSGHPVGTPMEHDQSLRSVTVALTARFS